MDLPAELRIPREGLINIKNRDKNVFHGVKEFQKLTSKLLNNLIPMELTFQCKKKILIGLK